MKLFLLLASILVCALSSAQQVLPVIRAQSKNAIIVEGGNERSNWGINPAIKPDIHIVSKITSPEWVGFFTDIDSIRIKLHPGESFDFIVLLNGRDSCYTRIRSMPVKDFAQQSAATHDTIPFVLTDYNNIKIKAVLNRVDTLDLKFDSGTTGLLLTNDAIKTKTHLSRNEQPDNTLQIGKLVWDSMEVYPVELSGQGTDGRFGWDLFDGRVVEIDYDHGIFIVHSGLPKIADGFTKLSMEYVQNLFCIQGELQVRGNKYKNRFLFDNGYQRTIMLDTIIMHEQNFPNNLELIKKVIMKNGQGREIPVLTVNNERLNLGTHSLLNIPVQLLATANPAGFKTHILGNEVLKRFNCFIDFKNNFVYLKPNSLTALPYADAK